MLDNEQQSNYCEELKDNREAEDDAPILIVDHLLHISFAAIIQWYHESKEVAEEVAGVETGVHECTIYLLVLGRYRIIYGFRECNGGNTHGRAEDKSSNHDRCRVLCELDDVEDQCNHVGANDELPTSKSRKQGASYVGSDTQSKACDDGNDCQVIEELLIGATIAPCREDVPSQLLIEYEADLSALSQGPATLQRRSKKKSQSEECEIAVVGLYQCRIYLFKCIDL